MTEAKTTTSKTTKSANGAAKAQADIFAAGRDAFETFFRAGTEAFSGNYDKWFAGNQERMTQAMGNLNNWDDVASTGKENVEALVASGKITAQGVEQITDKVMGIMTATFENNMALSKALFECKDVKEVLDLQTKHFRKAVDTWVAEGTELSELAMQTANKAMSPIGERVNATVEKVGKVAA